MKELIVFLDIDGVFNSNDYYRRRAEANPPKQDRGRSERGLSKWRWIKIIDPDAVREFADTVLHLEDNGWHVEYVISSTWRILNTLDEIHDYFHELALDHGISGYPRGRFHGMTQHLGGLRGEEISTYLHDMKTPPDYYLIVDDDSDMLDSQMDNFIHTDHAYGFTKFSGLRIKEKCAEFLLKESIDD